MQISKTTYFFITSLLALQFWNFTPIIQILNKDIILTLIFIWSIIGFIHYNPKHKLKILYSKKYFWTWILILVGVFISMLNAYFFWEQAIITTFIAQRFIYIFILLPTLLYIQPTFTDIKRGIKYISYITVICWFISITSPTLFGNVSEKIIEYNKQMSDIGYYVSGINFVVLYTYILIQDYIKYFTLKKIAHVIFWIIFILLYQNRSMLIGVILVFIFSIIKIKSKYKPIFLTCISLFIVIGIIYSWKIWSALISETSSQIIDQDYNRWKALYYYLGEYSPNIWCYIFGNGMPSGGNSAFGNLFWYNMTRGIHSSDLGLIGMWVDYGVLPLIGIYYMIFQIIIKKKFPLMLKFACFHILLIPTIFHFWGNQNAFFFIVLLYLYAYFNEYYIIKKWRKNLLLHKYKKVTCFSSKDKQITSNFNNKIYTKSNKNLISIH